MGMKTAITSKLLQATSDKTELNRQALRLKKSFGEVNKALGSAKKKEKEKKK